MQLIYEVERPATGTSSRKARLNSSLLLIMDYLWSRWRGPLSPLSLWRNQRVRWSIKGCVGGWGPNQWTSHCNSRGELKGPFHYSGIMNIYEVSEQPRQIAIKTCSVECSNLWDFCPGTKREESPDFHPGAWKAWHSQGCYTVTFT